MDQIPCTGDYLLSPPVTVTTIGTTELNFRVRNENGCIPCVKPPEQETRFINFR